MIKDAIKRLRAATTLMIAAIIAAGSSGCDRVGPAQPTTVPLPEISVDSPEWSGADGDRIVATVGDIRIPAWRVRDALAREKPGTSPEEILYSVIVEELIARRAAGDKGFIPDRKLYEKTIADRFIRKKIVEEFQPEDVPVEMLNEVWAIPQVWAKFNHVDLYDVQDYQWICCTDPNNCDPAVSDVCFKEGQAPMVAVRAALDRDQPDPSDLAILAPTYKNTAYHLTYQEYSFAWDKAAGYQKGAQHIDKTLAAEIMKLAPGQYTQPVKSKFGWHIARLAGYKPEEKHDLSDPAVRKEIGTVFIQRFRQNEFLKLMAGLAGVDSLRILRTYFENRSAPQGKPVYDVRVYPEALREATAVESDRTDGEIPQI